MTNLKISVKHTQGNDVSYYESILGGCRVISLNQKKINWVIYDTILISQHDFSLFKNQINYNCLKLNRNYKCKWNVLLLKYKEGLITITPTITKQQIFYNKPTTVDEQPTTNTLTIECKPLTVITTPIQVQQQTANKHTPDILPDDKEPTVTTPLADTQQICNNQPTTVDEEPVTIPPIDVPQQIRNNQPTTENEKPVTIPPIEVPQQIRNNQPTTVDEDPRVTKPILSNIPTKVDVKLAVDILSTQIGSLSMNCTSITPPHSADTTLQPTNNKARPYIISPQPTITSNITLWPQPTINTEITNIMPPITKSFQETSPQNFKTANERNNKISMGELSKAFEHLNVQHSTSINTPSKSETTTNVKPKMTLNDILKSPIKKNAIVIDSPTGKFFHSPGCGCPIKNSSRLKKTKYSECKHKPWCRNVDLKYVMEATGIKLDLHSIEN